MIPGHRAGPALCTILLIACEGYQPEPRLTGIEPNRAYTDRGTRLQLRGANLIPSFLLDPNSGRRVAKADGFTARLRQRGLGMAALTEVTWVATDRLSATLTEDQARQLAAGPCDVEITDPRGNTAVYAGGFTALGADTAGVTLSIDSPLAGTYVAPGTILSVSARACKQAPGRVGAVEWVYQGPDKVLVGACPRGDNPHEVLCSFDLEVDANPPAGLPEGAEIVLTFTANADSTETVPTVAQQRLSVQPLPRIAQITPDRGGTAGGTDVVIGGSGFAAGAQVLVDGVPLIANGGVRIDAALISGRMPPHAPGFATVEVRTGPGVVSPVAQFEYVAPPTLHKLSTDWGLADQDTSVEISGTNFTNQTHIFLGPTLSHAVRVESQTMSDTLIRALFPAGPTGRTTVWALDSDVGWTSLANGFTWRATPL